MITINNLLEIGKTGLLAHKARMAVVAHNVANVDTPGYHRQRVLLQTQPPISSFGSAYKYYFGTGVKIADIIRDYNQMTEGTLREQTSNSAMHGQLAQALQDAQAMLAGNDDANLGTILKEFWHAWQDVANNPENTAYRNILLQRTSTLTAQFNNLADRMGQYREEILLDTGDTASGAIQSNITEINSLGDRIANLNKKINIISLYGSNPNDLMDSRDTLLGRLTELTNVDVVKEQDGSYTVTIDGQILVSTDNSYHISVTDDGAGPNDITLEIELPGGGSAVVNPTEGTLGGWLGAANEFEGLMGKLDTMAAEIVLTVNAIHNTGYDLNGNTNIDFFDPAGISAATINLSGTIADHPEAIAAAETRHLLHPGPPPTYTPNVGDGAIALQIADLCNQRIATLNNTTFSNYFTDMLSTLGAQVEAETDLANDAENVISSLKAALTAESGVNLDEEMVEMLSAQRAFAACSKIITVTDEMIQTILAM